MNIIITLKVELIHGRTYKTRQEAKTAIFEYIEGFYNRQRRHSYLGYLSPLISGRSVTPSCIFAQRSHAICIRIEKHSARQSLTQ